MAEKCPHCGAAPLFVNRYAQPPTVHYRCLSLNGPGGYEQSDRCRIAELQAENARLRERLHPECPTCGLKTNLAGYQAVTYCEECYSELEAENGELKAEVARLPCTADGVLITIGMAVWKPNYTKGAAIIHRRVESLVLNKRGWCVGTRLPLPDNLNARGLDYAPEELYSNEQATRAAKEESDAGSV